MNTMFPLDVANVLGQVGVIMNEDDDNVQAVLMDKINLRDIVTQQYKTTSFNKKFAKNRKQLLIDFNHIRTNEDMVAWILSHDLSKKEQHDNPPIPDYILEIDNNHVTINHQQPKYIHTKPKWYFLNQLTNPFKDKLYPNLYNLITDNNHISQFLSHNININDFNNTFNIQYYEQGNISKVTHELKTILSTIAMYKHDLSKFNQYRKELKEFKYVTKNIEFFNSETEHTLNLLANNKIYETKDILELL